MADVIDRRLSLVAAYDDIVRNTAVLTQGIETEFYQFVTNQNEWRSKCFDAENTKKQMNKEIKQLETETAALETRLRHARGQIDHEMNKRMKAETDKDSLQRQINIIRDLLVDKDNGSLLNDRDREKLAFLSYQPSTCDSPMGYNQHDPHLNTIDESGDLLSEYDYDKTQEEADLHVRRKRPSAPPIEDEFSSPEKKNKRQSRSHKKKKNHRRSNSAVVTTTTVTVTPDGPIEAAAEINAERRRRNSSPGKSFNRGYDEEFNENNNAGGILRERNRSPGIPVIRRVGSAGRGLNRPHDFDAITVIRKQTCQVCNKRIRFGKLVMKCKDCHASAHPNCKDQVPLPCSAVTPKHARAGAYDLADFTSDAPMVPAIVIHCVNEVEARGLDETGIYRKSSVESDRTELIDKFMKGRTPNLSNVNDIHAICGCLKEFLRGMKQPLLTNKLWEDFARASEIRDKDEKLACFYQAISQLPEANRDTLAFLMLHLQRVSESPGCRMTKENLAKIFGPTVMGCSERGENYADATMKMLSETRIMANVMMCLMDISTDYWANYIEENAMTDGIIRDFQTPQTPEVTAVPQSMLGPVYASGYDSEERRAYSIRPSRTRNVRRNPANFFDSPNYQ